MESTQAETTEEIEQETENVAQDVDAGAAGGGESGCEEGDEPNPAPIVSFDEESPPHETSREKAPEWVVNLRRENREKDRRIRELEARQKASESTNAPGAPEVGKKPTLEDPDIEYDEDKFATKMEAWVIAKRKRDDWETSQRTEAEKQGQEWKSRLGAYAKDREAMKGEDFEESEFAVQKSLTEIQQSIIIKAATSPAALVFALGKSPKKLAELAGITDPVRFAVEIGKLESKMGTTPSKNAPPPPERMISGSTATRASTDARLEKLREEAARTGNYTKVTEYKRSQRK